MNPPLERAVGFFLFATFAILPYDGGMAEKRRRRPIENEYTIEGLAPNPKNPRKPWVDEEKQAAFRRSLAQFGDLSGVVRNRTSGVLVGGHKRVAEFKNDKDATIQITESLEAPLLDGTVAHGYILLGSGVRFAFREVEWPKDKEDAAMLAANRWGAEWDWEGVSVILQELKGLEFEDFDLTGFDASELNPLLGAEWSPPPLEDLPGKTDDAGDGKEESTADPDISMALAMLQKFRVENGLPSLEESMRVLVHAYSLIEEEKAA